MEAHRNVVPFALGMYAPRFSDFRGQGVSELPFRCCYEISIRLIYRDGSTDYCADVTLMFGHILKAQKSRHSVGLFPQQSLAISRA